MRTATVGCASRRVRPAPPGRARAAATSRAAPSPVETILPPGAGRLHHLARLLRLDALHERNLPLSGPRVPLPPGRRLLRRTALRPPMGTSSGTCQCGMLLATCSSNDGCCSGLECRGGRCHPRLQPPRRRVRDGRRGRLLRRVRVPHAAGRIDHLLPASGPHHHLAAGVVHPPERVLRAQPLHRRTLPMSGPRAAVRRRHRLLRRHALQRRHVPVPGPRAVLSPRRKRLLPGHTCVNDAMGQTCR